MPFKYERFFITHFHILIAKEAKELMNQLNMIYAIYVIQSITFNQQRPHQFQYSNKTFCCTLVFCWRESISLWSKDEWYCLYLRRSGFCKDVLWILRHYMKIAPDSAAMLTRINCRIQSIFFLFWFWVCITNMLLQN